jgi:dipeptidase E
MSYAFEEGMDRMQGQDVRIIAAGGGGFTHGGHPALEDFCLTQLGKTRPRIGYIGSANGDDPIRIARFHARFAASTSAHLHLAMALDALDLSNHLAGLDMVYVGGGNTEAMIADWRANGWDRALAAAARRGVMLAGVSAGAVCWFDKFLYSSDTGQKRPLDGLGLIRGGACPHYSTEADRQAALMAAILDGTMPDSLAIDDGVAVLLGRDGPTAYCSAEVGAMAYHIRRRGDGMVITTPLAVSDG